MNQAKGEIKEDKLIDGKKVNETDGMLQDVGDEHFDETAKQGTPNRAPTTNRDEVDDFLGQKLFNPILYTRGVDSDCFHLILGGKVQVCSGNEGFMITQSAFNFLGAEALVRDDYRPDFSAKVIEQARILKITRVEYRKAISSIHQSKYTST